MVDFRTEILPRVRELEEEYGSMKPVPEDNPKYIALQKITGIKSHGKKSMTDEKKIERAKKRWELVKSNGNKGDGFGIIAKRIGVTEGSISGWVVDCIKYQLITEKEAAFYKKKNGLNIYAVTQHGEVIAKGMIEELARDLCLKKTQVLNLRIGVSQSYVMKRKQVAE